MHIRLFVCIDSVRAPAYAAIASACVHTAKPQLLIQHYQSFTRAGLHWPACNFTHNTNLSHKHRLRSSLQPQITERIVRKHHAMSLAYWSAKIQVLKLSNVYEIAIPQYHIYFISYTTKTWWNTKRHVFFCWSRFREPPPIRRIQSGICNDMTWKDGLYP